ncbi:hepcidin-2-like [Phyllobates terribilis]|uniref:hepcidin-2-like n=1 Tax=Phyllobates terribilis TaxID=111132 RepID=UPI003CCB4795
MKTLAVCLLLVLSLLIHQGLGASILGHNEVADSAEHLTSPHMEESHLEGARHRTKRYSHLSFCRYCCNCCKMDDCGVCCLT